MEEDGSTSSQKGYVRDRYPYLTFCNALGTIFQKENFAALFPAGRCLGSLTPGLCRGAQAYRESVRLWVFWHSYDSS
jgi:hypothetical protein